MSILFSPLKIRSVTLKNRIVVSPMCQYSATDGFANDWHLVHLGTRAVGGAGLVFTEATAVCPEGRISPYDLGLWCDEQIEPLKRITDFISTNGSVPGIQLAHAGRKASTTQPWMGDKLIPVTEGGWHTVAPSAIPFANDKDTPLELTQIEIATIVTYFKTAALRALKAGFEIIEIHAAHGYLINQFMSPLCNTRNDKYGGTFENRIRFLLEIIEAIRTVWHNDLPLFVRISAIDWAENGWTIEDSVKLAQVLKEKSIDLIDCSSGAVVSYAKISAKPNYQVPFAAAVRKTGVLTGAVGIIVSATQAEEILANQEADLIFMARELLRNPYFPINAALELDQTFNMPLQYERAQRRK